MVVIFHSTLNLLSLAVGEKVPRIYPQCHRLCTYRFVLFSPNPPIAHEIGSLLARVGVVPPQNSSLWPGLPGYAASRRASCGYVASCCVSRAGSHKIRPTLRRPMPARLPPATPNAPCCATPYRVSSGNATPSHTIADPLRRCALFHSLYSAFGTLEIWCDAFFTLFPEK